MINQPIAPAEGTELMWVKWVYLDGGTVKESVEDPGDVPKIKCMTFRELEAARKRLEELPLKTPQAQDKTLRYLKKLSEKNGG